MKNILRKAACILTISMLALSAAPAMADITLTETVSVEVARLIKGNVPAQKNQCLQDFSTQLSTITTVGFSGFSSTPWGPIQYRLTCTGAPVAPVSSGFTCDPTVNALTAPPGVAPCNIDMINAPPAYALTAAGAASMCADNTGITQTRYTPTFFQQVAKYTFRSFTLLKSDMKTETTDPAEAKFVHAFCVYVPQ